MSDHTIMIIWVMKIFSVQFFCVFLPPLLNIFSFFSVTGWGIDLDYGDKHLNAEFQRIARRDKKALFSDQCKEIEEKNRMGKTGDLFKKIRDTKGTFHIMMGSIKDRNGMDLTEAEDIKKRWQEYTEELYKKSS